MQAGLPFYPPMVSTKTHGLMGQQLFSHLATHRYCVPTHWVGIKPTTWGALPQARTTLPVLGMVFTACVRYFCQSKWLIVPKKVPHSRGSDLSDAANPSTKLPSLTSKLNKVEEEQQRLERNLEQGSKYKKLSYKANHSSSEIGQTLILSFRMLGWMRLGLLAPQMAYDITWEYTSLAVSSIAYSHLCRFSCGL
jgi:hypothetical protein